MEQHSKTVEVLKEKFNSFYLKDNNINVLEISESLNSLLAYSDIRIEYGDEIAYMLRNNKVVLIQERLMLLGLFNSIEASIITNNSGVPTEPWSTLLELINGLLYIFNNDLEMFYDDIRKEIQEQSEDIFRKMNM